ncbi:hypothetical protein [Sorangium cellulosum]|uniref:hypothetical protein n=1 Tax=Sorangium cellulosum TaxID=56 RepID=UPI001E4B735F|nr:hypothetical protein [Sorangium cellulosum]
MAAGCDAEIAGWLAELAVQPSAASAAAATSAETRGQARRRGGRGRDGGAAEEGRSSSWSSPGRLRWFMSLPEAAA